MLIFIRLKVTVDKYAQFIGDICGVECCYGLFRNDISMFFKLNAQEFKTLVWLKRPAL